MLGWFSLVLLVLMMTVPPLVYQYSTSLAEALPQKPTSVLSEAEATELWNRVEDCDPEECASITPCWVYRWLVAGYINDHFRKIDRDIVYHDISRMASKIAISHMRSNDVNRKSMLWSHLTHTNLSIWLQRNWSDREVATKYSQINSRRDM